MSKDTLLDELQALTLQELYRYDTSWMTEEDIKKHKEAAVRNTLIKEYKSGKINEKDLCRIFSKKPLSDFLEFLNGLGSHYDKVEDKIKRECRILLLGRNKSSETYLYLASEGNERSAERCSRIVAEKNEYFLPS